MFQLVKFVFLAVYFLTATCNVNVEAICPPPEDFTPCTCNNGTLVISCARINQQFDIKATFDKLSLIVPESTVFNELVISETSLYTIPYGTIRSFKFKNIMIEKNSNLTYISPNAFNSNSTQATESISLYNNALGGTISFEFWKTFNNLQRVSMIGNKEKTGISSTTLTSNKNLRSVFLGSNKFVSIGAFAFAGLTELSTVYMSSNDLDPNGISPDAFKNLSSTTTLEVDLTFNPLIDHLNETIFKSLLDFPVARLKVDGSRCNSVHCEYEYLYCDQRADWICLNVEEYKPKLTGFLCVGGGLPKDVWEYCEINNKIA
jgi:hypothetical protein